VVGLEWYTKVMVGYSAGIQCTSQDWLAALDMAVHGQCPRGTRDQGLSLMRDNGCQPTALACMRACATVESHQAFTRDTSPQGNADTECVIRTLKEACLWRQEWTCPSALISALTVGIDDDKAHDLHSALGDKSPGQFARDYDTSRSPPFVAA
jgi:putative transposase